jgi:dTDP-4-amino-4,6-dideoxygalactose transaminase
LALHKLVLATAIESDSVMSFGLKIPFNGLRKQYHNLRQEILDATDGVLRSGQLMSGNHTAEFENWLAQRNNVKYAVTCHSGTQALEIMARYYRSKFDLQPHVLIPSLTYPATVNAFESSGWVVHLADTDDRGNLDLSGSTPSDVDAIVLIGLYGAPVTPWLEGHNWIARMGWNKLLILEDAAQHWLSADCVRVGRAAAVSFDPTKNLANYGNGGAVITDDRPLAEWVRIMRDNGKPDHRTTGTNSRISEVDAAQLMTKTKYLDAWQQRRRDIAGFWINRFRSTAARCLIDPAQLEQHAVQKFVIDIDHRDHVQQSLAQRHIETRVHYPRPCHELPAFHHLPGAPDILSRASALSRRVLSLPIYPELTDLEVEYIADQVLDCVSG